MADALTLGRRLRFHRKQAGLTLQQLGELVGRPAPYLSMLENGRRQAKPDQVEDLASALGIDTADLLTAEPPTPRAALEIELERRQAEPRFRALELPYVRPSSTMADELLQHLVGLYRALGDGAALERTGRSRLRRANAATAEWIRSHDGYLSDLEAVASGVLSAVGHEGEGPLSSRTLLDIAAHLGYEIQAVDDMIAGVRSITDRRSGRIYIAQRNELRTRQARKAVLQTLAGHLLDHAEPDDTEEFLRQRVETAYLASAILVPEQPVVRRLRAAMDQRDISIEDIKEVFYVSYEMAAWRFVNLATEHLGMRSHLIVTGAPGTVVKGYSNDGLPFVTDAQGGVEAQPVCRHWGAVAVFGSEDKFDVHAQYTDTPAGTYFCVTHMEPDRPYSVTVGVPFDSAQWFRDRSTTRREASSCPDPSCCRLPTPDQAAEWDGQIEVSMRAQDRLLGRLASDPYPGERDRRVYDLVERHSD
ncbi:MAG TPA: XRE family transcriptional regulator [Acidimicrobiia bacterium]|nr:XRE family transcriptional regulator [Acidimicrobiia bacterium]